MRLLKIVLILSLLRISLPLRAEQDTPSRAVSPLASSSAVGIDVPYQKAADDNNSGPHLSKKIALEARINHKKVPLNGFLELTIELSWQGLSQEVIFEELPTPISSNLNLMGTTVTNESKKINGNVHSSKTYLFTFRPQESGEAKINALAINYRDRDENHFTLNTQTFIVSVLPPSILNSLSKGDWQYQGLIKAGIIVITILGSVFFLVWRRKSKRKRTVARKNEYEKLVEQLEEADRLRLGENEADFCVLIAQIMRCLLGHKHKFRTIGMTTQDILERLPQNSEAHSQQNSEISIILTVCDEVKYTHSKITSDKRDYLFERTRNLVQEFGTAFLATAKN